MYVYRDITYHIKNAEITPELHDDLINFSFVKLQDVFRNSRRFIRDPYRYTFLTFIPYLLADLKNWYGIVFTQAWSSAYLYSAT